ncbi:MAG: peptidylprolyl isomerase [Bacillota bacterium]|nr:peptidylprolyl isomerase [Bacillota bacterium]
MKASKIILFILSFTVLLSSSACSSNNEKKKSSYNSTDIAATIGDVKVPKYEFIFYLKNAKRDMEGESGVKETNDINVLKKYWSDKVNNVVREDEAKKKSLQSIKELIILLTKAKSQNLQLDQKSKDTVKAHMDNLIKTKGNGDRKKAEQVIKETYGVNLFQYESIYNDYLLGYDIFVNKFKQDLNISDKDIRDYYNKNIKDYENKVIVKHILISNNDEKTGEKLTGAKLEEKKKLAEDILQKAKSGSDFESLVLQYSQDPGVKENHGQISFTKGQTMKEFDNWAFNAKDGDIGLVETQYGYHVIKFIKKSTYDDEKANIKERLENDAYDKKFNEWVNAPEFTVKPNQSLIDSISILQ